MKNYGDLQRFKEKTQTLDIAFKDMSGQMQEAAEHSKWALIRQLATDEPQASLGGGQRIDLPQPQPLRGDEFHAPPPATPARPAVLSPQPAMAARSSILDSLAGSSATVENAADRGPSSLFPPPLLKPTVAEPVATLHPEPVRPAAVTTLQSAAAPAAIRPEPGRFGALFRSRDMTLPKETLLKPLLEKIALCR